MKYISKARETRFKRSKPIVEDAKDLRTSGGDDQTQLPALTIPTTETEQRR